VSNRPPLKPALHTKTSLLVVVPRYGPIYPLRRSERLKAGAHSTLSSPRCQVLNCKIAHPHYLARREKTQRDKRLKKMRGPARCQSGDGRARPGRTSKETEKRTRTSDTREKKRGRKSEPPPAPGARESGRGKPQLSRHVIPLAAVGPSLVRLSCFCSFQKISLLFYFSRRARGEVMWHDKGHRFATQLRIVRPKNQRYCRNIIDVRRIMKLCIHRPIENTASILFYLSVFSLKIN
jgi:hypothetical protein